MSPSAAPSTVPTRDGRVVRVTVRLPADLAVDLARRAQARGVTISDVIRDVLAAEVCLGGASTWESS